MQDIKLRQHNTIDCQHWHDIDVFGGGRCELGLFGGIPSYLTCARACQANPARVLRPGQYAPRTISVPGTSLVRPKGFGDTIANGIHRVSRGLIKPCGGCKKRQALLNKVLPYR
jgi:hypothetical protein